MELTRQGWHRVLRHACFGVGVVAAFGCSHAPPDGLPTARPSSDAAAATTANAAAAAATATGTSAPATAPAPTADAAALRDWVRDLTRQHCGTCHIASLPTAKPAALAIFNLDAPNWSSTLSPQRLRAGFTRRLNGKLDEAGQLRLREFVESEIASR